MPLGVALIARDSLIEATRAYRTPVAASNEIRRQLRRFERRGAGGRDSIQHQADRRQDQVIRMIRRKRDTPPPRPVHDPR